MEKKEENLIQRPFYTGRLESWLGQEDLVKIVTGVRRCGKSKLFSLFQQLLVEKKHVSYDQIININLESTPQIESIGLKYNEKKLLTNYNELFNFIVSKLNKDKMNYVFIDEIQLLEDWFILANSLRLQENLDLYLTGSNAYMYSWDLANSFGGRYIEIKIQPFSFKEYYDAYSEKNETPHDLFEIYESYIKESGFPQTIKFKHDKDLINDYLLNTVYLNTVQKDIIKRYNIKDTNKLDSVIKYIFDNIGNETSINNMVKTLKSSTGSTTSAPTVNSYIKGLLDSYLIYKCDRYNIKGKQYLDSNPKYYVVDAGLRTTLLGSFGKDLGHILENIVYLELLRRGYNVYVGKVNYKITKENNKNIRKLIEVDFVAKKRDTVEYYQVALHALEPDILERELAPLEEIKDNYPKYLLTLDYGNGEINGIKRLNVLKWLLDV